MFRITLAYGPAEQLKLGIELLEVRRDACFDIALATIDCGDLTKSERNETAGENVDGIVVLVPEIQCQ